MIMFVSIAQFPITPPILHFVWSIGDTAVIKIFNAP